MNQAYLTYRLQSMFSLKAGLFYTNTGGYQPSAGIQFFLQHKNWVLVATPRIDIAKKGAYEMFAMTEFTPSLTKTVRLYTRLQAMSNFGKENHYRSYQLLRLGLSIKGFEIGGGISLDEYGTSPTAYSNTGIFIRRML